MSRINRIANINPMNYKDPQTRDSLKDKLPELQDLNELAWNKINKKFSNRKFKEPTKLTNAAFIRKKGGKGKNQEVTIISYPSVGHPYRGGQEIRILSGNVKTSAEDSSIVNFLENQIANDPYRLSKTPLEKYKRSISASKARDLLGKADTKERGERLTADAFSWRLNTLGEGNEIGFENPKSLTLRTFVDSQGFANLGMAYVFLEDSIKEGFSLTKSNVGTVLIEESLTPEGNPSLYLLGDRAWGRPMDLNTNSFALNAGFNASESSPNTDQSLSNTRQSLTRLATLSATGTDGEKDFEQQKKAQNRSFGEQRKLFQDTFKTVNKFLDNL